MNYTYTFKNTGGRLSDAELDEANDVISSARTEDEAWALLNAYEAAKTDELDSGWAYGLAEAIAEDCVIVLEDDFWREVTEDDFAAVTLHGVAAAAGSGSGPNSEWVISSEPTYRTDDGTGVYAVLVRKGSRYWRKCIPVYAGNTLADAGRLAADS